MQFQESITQGLWNAPREPHEAINRTADELYPHLYVFGKISTSWWPYIGLLWGKNVCADLSDLRKLLLKTMQRQLLNLE